VFGARKWYEIFRRSEMDDFDPYKFDTPDTYALKTGDPSTGGLEDPAKGALPKGSSVDLPDGSEGLSLAEKIVALVGGLALLFVAIASW
jgi:hypothetical protein